MRTILFFLYRSNRSVCFCAAVLLSIVLTVTDVLSASTTPQIAGKEHTISLKSDGTVWTWGDNAEGQLGDGTTTDRTTPVQASGLSNVIGIAGGFYHSVALKSDGTVWAWGNNHFGRLGDGTTTDKHYPDKGKWVGRRYGHRSRTFPHHCAEVRRGGMGVGRIILVNWEMGLPRIALPRYR